MNILYLFVGGMLQDYPLGIWPLCLIIAGVIIIQAEIKRWRNRHG